LPLHDGQRPKLLRGPTGWTGPAQRKCAEDPNRCEVAESLRRWVDSTKKQTGSGRWSGRESKCRNREQERSTWNIGRRCRRLGALWSAYA